MYVFRVYADRIFTEAYGLVMRELQTPKKLEKKIKGKKEWSELKPLENLCATDC